MTLCVLKRILRKKKSIFMQPLESPITPLTVAALRMIICKRPVPPDDHLQEASPSVSSFARGRPLRMTICKRPVPLDHHLQEAGPPFWQPRQGRENCIFETLYNEKRCVLSVKESNINEKNQNFHICLRSGPRWLTFSLTIKCPFFYRLPLPVAK